MTSNLIPLRFSVPSPLFTKGHPTPAEKLS